MNLSMMKYILSRKPNNYNHLFLEDQNNKNALVYSLSNYTTDLFRLKICWVKSGQNSLHSTSLFDTFLTQK